MSTLKSSGEPVCALIIGAPGSGKGTISNWIVRDFGLKHVSSGDLLRDHMNRGTPLGLEAKKFISKGDLVPDETMVGLISTALKEMKGQPWLLDGFPRTQPQAAALQSETPVNVVINLDVPFETIIDRIKGDSSILSKLKLLWCPIKMRVFHQNESCLSCLHPPSSYEGRREQGRQLSF